MDNKKDLDIVMYTVKEVAGLINVTPRTVRQYINDNKLKAKKIGGKWVVFKEDLEKYIRG